MLQPVLVSAPANLIADLEAVKRHCNILHDDDDELLSALIKAAASYLEGGAGIMRRPLIDQVWKQSYAGFCDLRFHLGAANTVSAFKYFDLANVEQDVPIDRWRMLTDDCGSYITLEPLKVWPPAFVRADAVTVTWTAGYGANGGSVPAAIVHAMNMLVAHWYENRETTSTQAGQGEIPFAVSALLAPFRRISV
jgi:uncharacterized phiE125 gp8 family phage protein